MRNFLIAVGLLSALLFSGCGYKEGVSTGKRVSFLYFSGNTENVSVSVDGGEQFTVMSGRDHQYEVLPGKHKIVVYRQGAILVEREVYLGDGISKEIGVN